jgi:hypothetical protein
VPEVSRGNPVPVFTPACALRPAFAEWRSNVDVGAAVSVVSAAHIGNNRAPKLGNVSKCRPQGGTIDDRNAAEQDRQ